MHYLQFFSMRTFVTYHLLLLCFWTNEKNFLLLTLPNIPSRFNIPTVVPTVNIYFFSTKEHWQYAFICSFLNKWQSNLQLKHLWLYSCGWALFWYFLRHFPSNLEVSEFPSRLSYFAPTSYDVMIFWYPIRILSFVLWTLLYFFLLLV